MPKKETPYLKQYHMQKATAKQRGVPFELSFEEWLDWWGDDVEKRGRNRPDAMVMGLIRPELGYRLDNIEKRTKAEHSTRTIESIPNGFYGRSRRPIKTPDGVFPSLSAAAKHYQLYTMTVRTRCYSKDPRFTDWYFL